MAPWKQLAKWETGQSIDAFLDAAGDAWLRILRKMVGTLPSWWTLKHREGQQSVDANRRTRQHRRATRFGGVNILTRRAFTSGEAASLRSER